MQTLRQIKFAMAATAAIIVTACGPTVETRGNLIDEQRLSQIQVGQTTREDVAFILGTPSVTAPFHDDEAWFYVGQIAEKRAFFQPQIVDRKVVALAFNEAGFVEAVERLDLQDGEDVRLVNRETPTRGRQFTLVEQLIGNLGQRLGQSMD